MSRYMLCMLTTSFLFPFLLIYQIIFFPGLIEKSFYFQIVVNSLIIRLVRPDLPTSFYRNVHFYAEILSV